MWSLGFKESLDEFGERTLSPSRFKDDIAIRPHVVGDIRHADAQSRRLDHGEVVCGITNGDDLGHRNSQHIGKAREPVPLSTPAGMSSR